MPIKKAFEQRLARSKGYFSLNLPFLEKNGEGGIRTPVQVALKPDFKSGAFNHSATSPRGIATEYHSVDFAG